jgi:hypothetical protein
MPTYSGLVNLTNEDFPLPVSQIVLSSDLFKKVYIAAIQLGKEPTLIYIGDSNVSLSRFGMVIKTGQIKEIEVDDESIDLGANLYVYVPVAEEVAISVVALTDVPPPPPAPGGYTDEMAQDAIGSILQDSATVDFTYNDAIPSITAEAIGGGGGYTDEQAQDAIGTILVNSSTIDFSYNDSLPSISASVSNIPQSSVSNLISDLAGKQPLDSTLTALAAFNTNGYLKQNALDTFVGIASIPQADITNLVSDLAAKQPLDSTLTAFAAFNTNGYLKQNAADTFVGVASIPQADVASLVSDLAGKVPTTRTLTANSPITGGGDLSANRSFGFDAAALLDNNARVAVNKNSGAVVGTRRRLNFIEGTNVTLTIADDAGNEEVDVTIAAAGGGGSGLSVVLITGNSGNANIAAAPSETWQVLSADATANATTTYATVMTTSNLAAGTYSYRYQIVYRSTVTTTGVKFRLDFSGTVTRVRNRRMLATTGTTQATGVADSTANVNAGSLMEAYTNITDAADLGPNAGVSATTDDQYETIEGLMVVSTTGNLILQHASETAASTQVRADTCLFLKRLA